VLTINTSKVTVEQFRADLPRIAAKLEGYLAGGQSRRSTLNPWRYRAGTQGPAKRRAARAVFPAGASPVIAQQEARS